MNDDIIEIFRFITPAVELAIGLLFWFRSSLRRRKLIATGFFMYALNSIIWRYFALNDFEGVEGWRSFAPWLYFMALVFVFIGVFGSVRKSKGKKAPMIAPAMNRYFSTDELVSRAGELSAVNDDLERFKTEWKGALQPLVDESPDYTSLVDLGKYGRRLVLERYCEMGEFESFGCGQLRSVELVVSGPGDFLPWLTVRITYYVDQVEVRSSIVNNEMAIRFRENLSGLREFGRIKSFLSHGNYRRTISEKFEDLLYVMMIFAMLPVQAVVLFFGIPVRMIRNLLNRRKVATRFVTARKPEVLPPEQRGAPNGYWYVLLEDQAEKREELMTAVSAGLADRGDFGAKTYTKEVVQWGGYTLKEVREQLVVEFRRGAVHIGIYCYGKDLYVRWDSHFNHQIWELKKFTFHDAVGYRFRKDLFSWSRPLFEEVPSIYEYAPSFSRTTDYDWADIDALEGLVHEVVTREVKGFRERYQIEKEIDFELKKGAGEAQPDRRDKPKAKRTPLSWAKGFVRRQ